MEAPRSRTSDSAAWLQPSTFARRILAGTPLEDTSPVVGRLFERDFTQLAQVGSFDSGPALFAQILQHLDIRYSCGKEDLRQIPESGALVIVANHPFGLVEGPVLWSALSGVRSDIKFLANSLLAAVPQLRDVTIPVDPFGGPEAVRSNWKPVREAVSWVRQGHTLVVFPAGEVATLDWQQRQITDPEWNSRVARIVRLTGASVLPVFFHGSNSPAFHLAGLIHPRLRTLLLPHELLNKGHTTIRVSIGRPIPASRLPLHKEPDQVTGYLRARTMLLGARAELPVARKIAPLAPVAGAVDARLLRREIDQLPEAQKLHASGELAAYIADASQIPNILQEIGRLREVTFRGVGEGTGRPLDLDEFDRYYHHLFLWNAEKSEIVGAYRFADTSLVRGQPDPVERAFLPAAGFLAGAGPLNRSRPRRAEALRQAGMPAPHLYTSTLFRTSPGFLDAISPALELGRSFVRAEYQRTYQPLLMLWKAIGKVVADNPRFRFLFGPVSISQSYSAPSRSLMVTFLRSQYSHPDLAVYVQPRHKFRTRPLKEIDTRNFSTLVESLEDLSEIIAELEPDHKTVPILIQQYLNLGGRILDFSVDGRFSNVLDGLVLVDLTKTNPRLLERYLGKAGAETFRAYHGLAEVPGRSGQK